MKKNNPVFFTNLIKKLITVIHPDVIHPEYTRIHVCDCNHIYVRGSIFINFEIELININTIMTLKYKIGKKSLIIGYFSLLYHKFIGAQWKGNHDGILYPSQWLYEHNSIDKAFWLYEVLKACLCLDYGPSILSSIWNAVILGLFSLHFNIAASLRAVRAWV